MQGKNYIAYNNNNNNNNNKELLVQDSLHFMF